MPGVCGIGPTPRPIPDPAETSGEPTDKDNGDISPAPDWGTDVDIAGSLVEPSSGKENGLTPWLTRRPTALVDIFGRVDVGWVWLGVTVDMGVPVGPIPGVAIVTARIRPGRGVDMPDEDAIDDDNIDDGANGFGGLLRSMSVLWGDDDITSVVVRASVLRMIGAVLRSYMTSLGSGIESSISMRSSSLCSGR